MRMKSLIFHHEIFLIVPLTIFFRLSCHANQINDERIIDYMAENKFLQGKAEIVFLLDRSGSVGAANFEIQKGFIESLLTQVKVEVNATRVAVISYSNDVVRHIDYLREPKNKCFLSQELLNVKFENSGATNIAAALDEALDVFQNARHNVNKVVILISDGLATAGGNPRPHADKLKQTGAQIFAFGVGRFLQTELLSLASSERHIYSCSEFKEFKQLAKKIRGDPHEVSWSGQASTPNCDHLCNSPYKGEEHDPGCCDHNARCSCALLSGMHTCVCGPGYFGLSGIAGHCKGCPKGTYKSKTEPTEKCERCPAFSTTAKEASTSINDCLCKEGYNGNISAGIHCAAIQCPNLQNPTDGFILGECRSTYGSTCHFMCNDGYELVDKSSDIRTCRSDGTWTEKSTVCQKIHCNALLAPTFGSKLCDRRDLKVGTTCQFRCINGFIMKGSEVRECLPSKRWSGADVSCLAKECPVPQGFKHGIIYGCQTYQKGRFEDTCIFRCNYGFTLIGADTQMCNENGKWMNSSNMEERVFCKDTQPPQIKCPGRIKLITNKGKDYAVANWTIPRPSDNSGYEPKLKTVPPNVFPPLPFLIGISGFNYTAIDMSGLTSNCSVIIEVIDIEPPKIVSCPSKIEVSTTDISEIVEWEEPVFLDNDGLNKLIIKKSHNSGDSFNLGSHTVTYHAIDSSGNRARCAFDVLVSRTECPYHPPPTNGALSCEDLMYGQFCQVFCNDQFDFIHKPAEWYVCNADAQWDTAPKRYPIPWPDCARPSIPSLIRKMVKGFYYEGDCNNPKVQMVIKNQFLDHLTRKFSRLGFCKNGCSIDKVTVKCGRSDPNLSFRRKRRNVQEESEKEEIEVEFDINIDFNHVELNDTDSMFTEFMDTIKNLQFDIESDLNMDLSRQSPSAENEIYDIPTKSRTLAFTDEETIIICHPGSILTDGLCVSCPPGTFFSNDSQDCMDCPIGYYQTEEGQMQCDVCPEETSTEYTRTKNVGECKGICLPGSYSASGLETCVVCPLGTFQQAHGAKTCEACPNGTTTTDVQSTSFSECKEACDPGSFSESGLMPCYPCPKNSYQPEKQQKKCIECPFPLSSESEGATNFTECIDQDPCAGDSVCENGGQCVRSGREAACRCHSGFEGSHCEIDIDECGEEPCLNGGLCVNQPGSYNCVCKSGFEGENCHTEINECLSLPCHNNGTCIDQVDGYICVCGHNYQGSTCDSYMDTCSRDIICLNGGICKGLNENESHCICSVGYGGSDCSINLNDCQNVTCSDRGRCIDGLASYSCLCNKGYTGTDCEEEIDECQNHSCNSGATCNDLIGGYQCLCPPGWSGSLCENKLDSDFVLMFPEDQASIANMASTTITLPLSEVTISMWIQTTDSIRSGTPLSYAVTTSHTNSTSENVTMDNALTISDCSGIQIYVNNNPLMTDVDVADGKWHHLAFTWSSDNSGSWDLYKDDQLQAQGKQLSPQSIISGGGVLVIGQEQDTVGGGFSPLESFFGNITRVNVWNHYFSHSHISRLYSMDDDIPGKEVSWPDFLSHIDGNVQIVRNEITL